LPGQSVRSVAPDGKSVQWIVPPGAKEGQVIRIPY